MLTGRRNCRVEFFQSRSPSCVRFDPVLTMASRCRVLIFNWQYFGTSGGI